MTGFPEGKQSEIPVALGQYSKPYEPLARWQLKPSCSEEIFLLSNCSLGVSKLVEAISYGATIDLLTTIISGCCLEEIELLSLFSHTIIPAQISLLSKGKRDILSCLEVAEVFVFSFSKFLFIIFMDLFLEVHLTVLPDQFAYLSLHYFYLVF